MMNKQTEALKMAIEALEWIRYGERTNKQLEAIEACKEALEQPTQEPVAWIDEFGNCEFTYAMWVKEEPNVTWTPVYTHPAPSWQGLSDDEIDSIAHACNLLDDYPHKFVRAIEAKLKEKNNVNS